jgi:general secretion pathway protein E
VRLANVAMTRENDGKPLDLEMLTQWLAGAPVSRTCASIR